MNAAATLSIDADAEAFLEKWLRAWPALAYAKLFASEGEWPGLRARVGVAFELAEASWLLSDATVREHKLLWWQEELALHAAGKARHPLLKPVPTLTLPADIATSALANLHAAAPTDADAALSRIAQIATRAEDAEIMQFASTVVLSAMYLLTLQTAAPSAFAQAPLDLRARFGVADATSSAALNALVSSLAHAWCECLTRLDAQLPKSCWQGARGQRILTRLGLDLLHALARGKEPAASHWRNTLRAWSTVAGLR